jgi:uncharacterized protein with HEPN domain
MTDATKKLLLDIAEAGESILQHTGGHTLADYSGNRFFRRAVEREFEIIGEALNRLTRIDAVTAARVSDLRVIVDFRNRIIHGYDTVDDKVVWGAVEQYLPRLVDEIRAIRRSSETKE